MHACMQACSFQLAVILLLPAPSLSSDFCLVCHALLMLMQRCTLVVMKSHYNTDRLGMTVHAHLRIFSE